MILGFLTPEYPHPSISGSAGIGTSIKNLAESYVKLGFRVFVFIYQQVEDEVIIDSGIILVKIKNPKFKGLSWWLVRIKIQNLVNSYVKKERISLIEIPDWTGISAFITFDCPIVLKLHGSDTYFCNLEKRSVKIWNKFMERRAFTKADHVVAVSGFVGNISCRLFKNNRKIDVIHNGISLELFKPSLSEIGPFFSSDSFTILYFGTLIRKKGLFEIPVIANLFLKKVPEAKLILVGGDSADILTGSPSTWKLISPLFDPEINSRVHYLGKIPYSQIRSKIEDAQVCLFPSFAEAFPVSWLEAMAMERVVIASDFGWSRELIDDRIDGFLFDPTDHEGIANCLYDLYFNPELLRLVGKNAREKIKKSFTNDQIANQHIEYFEKCVKF
jgi:glycosyltransferase involved in cell wall biosynthesis